jgi:hypothetical protein
MDAGRVVDVVFDPSSRDVFYVGSAGGGVWKTTSGGASWAPLTDDQCVLNIGAMAVDPRAPNVVYAATGELNTESIGCGVLRSVDGGASWQLFGAAQLGPQAGRYASAGALYIDPATAGTTSSTTLLLATTTGVYRSTNSGQSWTQALGGYEASVVASPRDPNVLYTASSNIDANTVGLFRSTDKGATWSPLPMPNGLTADRFERAQLATSAAAPDELWMAVSNYDFRLEGLWRWDNSAGAWTQLGASGLYNGAARGDFGEQVFYDFVLAVDPTDSQRIYLGGERLFRSLDGGNSFARIAGDIHVDWHALRIDPADPLHLIGGNDGGVFVSTDGGDSWTGHNAGLAITQFYQGISVNPILHGYFAAGSQDNGTSVSNSLPIWEQFMDGDGGFTAMSPDGKVLWMEGEWGGFGPGPGILRLDLASFSFREVDGGIDANDRAEFIPPLVMHPLQPSTLYFGTQRLYRTTDEVTWQAVSTSADLTKGSGTITRIAVARSHGDTVYVGTSDGWVRMSADSGVTFAAAGSGFPNRYVTGIAIDPQNAAHVFASVSGFGTPHLWQSTDAGVTWTASSGSGDAALPDVPANAVLLLTGTSDVVVGTDVGVWVSADNGSTWQQAGGGLPNVEVMDVAYDASTQRLVAATHGRGAWAVPITAPTPVLRGDVNLDGVIDANDALLVMYGLVNRPTGQTALGTPVQLLPYGDANCNGQLETSDALVLLRQAVGLTTAGSCAGQTRSLTPIR